MRSNTLLAINNVSELLIHVIKKTAKSESPADPDPFLLTIQNYKKCFNFPTYSNSFILLKSQWIFF